MLCRRAKVWWQPYTLQDDRVIWRSAKELPPCAQRIQSPYDPHARYSRQRTTQWVGYKTHFTETCDDDTPHLMTQVTTTASTTQDVAVVHEIQSALVTQDCPPQDHIVDTGYSAADLLLDGQTQRGIALIAPVRPEPSWQVRQPTGFEAAQFQIDWERQPITCPQGKVSTHWTPCPAPRGHTRFYVKFSETDCRPCPIKAACTQGKRRAIGLPEQAILITVAAQREFQTTATFRALYQ
jgi:transposase